MGTDAVVGPRCRRATPLDHRRPHRQRGPSTCSTPTVSTTSASKTSPGRWHPPAHPVPLLPVEERDSVGDFGTHLREFTEVFGADLTKPMAVTLRAALLDFQHLRRGQRRPGRQRMRLILESPELQVFDDPLYAGWRRGGGFVARHRRPTDGPGSANRGMDDARGWRWLRDEHWLARAGRRRTVPAPGPAAAFDAVAPPACHVTIRPDRAPSPIGARAAILDRPSSPLPGIPADHPWSGCRRVQIGQELSAVVPTTCTTSSASVRQALDLRRTGRSRSTAPPPAPVVEDGGPRCGSLVGDVVPVFDPALLPGGIAPG